jgi:hypothetical protein
MNARLFDERAWAEQEFGEVQSGDERRTNRLVQVAAAMALKPGESLPAAMEGPAELKAAYRLFSCEELRHSNLLERHCERTAQACQQPGRYLFIGDTTDVDYTAHPATVDLGHLGEHAARRGFLLHSTLAVAISAPQLSSKGNGLEMHHHRELVGIFDQKLWKRPHSERLDKKAKKHNGWRGAVSRPRESDRWIETIERMSVPPQAQWIYVADRESDIYECLQSAQRGGVDFVIRAAYPRKLQQQEGDLFGAVAEAPVLGTTKVRLRPRVGHKARTATLELRVRTVEVSGPKRPGGRLEPITVTVVEAREKRPSRANQESTQAKAGEKNSLHNKAKEEGRSEEPLHWVLLTSLPASTLLEALEVVVIYRERWLIEDYHKALKSGTKVERIQLESANALESVIGITAIIAVRLLSLQLLAAKAPQTPLPASYSDPQVLAILEARFGPPKEGWTIAEYLRAIARLGGFLGRKCDGSPGWITLWRGIREISSALRIIDLLTAQKKCG